MLILKNPYGDTEIVELINNQTYPYKVENIEIINKNEKVFELLS